MEDYVCMGKNFLSLIKTRRSIRAYKSESVPSKALDAVLEAGTYVEDGSCVLENMLLAVRCNFLHRTICGKEEKYANQ